MVQSTFPRSTMPRSISFALVCAALIGSIPGNRISAQTGGANLREDLLIDLVQLQDKWVDLAEAIDWDQYGWAPMEGTRSIGDVFMHIAGANVMIPDVFAEFDAPVDLPSSLQNLVPGGVPPMPTSKAGVITALTVGFENVRRWIGSLSAEDLLVPREFLGAPTTTRTLAVFAVSHAHEHLGQQIAYARSIAVVPPWTRGQR